LVGSVVPDLRGLFLRGYGSQAHSQNNGSTIGVSATNYSSGALNAVQGDAIRNITAEHNSGSVFGIWRGGNCISTLWSGAFYCNRYSSYWNSAVSQAPQHGGEGADQSGSFGVDISRVTPTANENRPINIAVRYLIRALL
jgi:hypothetical protein